MNFYEKKRLIHGIKRGKCPRTKAIIQKLGDHLFILERILDKPSIGFIKEKYRDLQYSELYNKPFFITERMQSYAYNLNIQLNKKLSEFSELYKKCKIDQI